MHGGSGVTPLRLSEIQIPESGYILATFRNIWEELPLWIVSSLCLVIAAFPALWLASVGNLALCILVSPFSVAPCLSSYCYVFGRNSAHYKVRLSDFILALRHFYTRSVLAALPLALMLLIVRTTYPWLWLAPPVPVIAGIILQILALLFLVLLSLYIFPLLAVFDLRLRLAWSYSMVLVVRWPVVAIGLLSLTVLLASSTALVGPVVLPMVPLIVIPVAVNTALVLIRRATADTLQS